MQTSCAPFNPKAHGRTWVELTGPLFVPPLNVAILVIFPFSAFHFYPFG